MCCSRGQATNRQNCNTPSNQPKLPKKFEPDRIAKAHVQLLVLSHECEELVLRLLGYVRCCVGDHSTLRVVEWCCCIATSLRRVPFQ